MGRRFDGSMALLLLVLPPLLLLAYIIRYVIRRLKR